MKISTKTNRFLAYLLDSVILSIVFTVLVTVYFLVIGGSVATLSDNSDNTGLGIVATVASIVFIVLTIVIILWYYVFYPAANNGATLGKKVLKMKVINKDGSAVSKLKLFLRSIILSLGIINFITIFFMEENQTLCDIVLGTRVVDAQ